MKSLFILSILLASSQAVADTEAADDRAFMVMDEHGDPIEGATVFPSSWAELDAEGELTRIVGRPVYRTDENGEVRLPRSRAYPEQRLLVLAPGKEPVVLPFNANEARLNPVTPRRIPLTGVPAGATCTATIRSDNAFAGEGKDYSLSTRLVRIGADALELPWVPGGRPLLAMECRPADGSRLRAGDRSLSPLPEEVALHTGTHQLSLDVGFPYAEHTPSLVGIQCEQEQFIFVHPEEQVRFRHLPSGRCRIFGHWSADSETATAEGHVEIPADSLVRPQWRTESLDEPHSPGE